MAYVTRRFFTHDIVVETYLGTDEYSNDVFGAPFTLKGRQEERNEEGHEDDRDTLLQRARVFFYGNPTLGLNDRVTLLDGPQFPILMLYKHRGPGAKVDYIEAVIGRRAGD